VDATVCSALPRRVETSSSCTGVLGGLVFDIYKKKAGGLVARESGESIGRRGTVHCTCCRAKAAKVETREMNSNSYAS
jgi:hypothetical protein